MKKIINILCVCMGNTCRSPMMVAFLKKKFKDVGIEINVESAGVINIEGAPVSRHTLTIMAQYGIDVSDHRSRFAKNLSLNDYQIIYCVDQEIRQRMIEFGATASQTVIVNEANGGIPNPMGTSYKEYEDCARLIKEETTKIVNELY